MNQIEIIDYQPELQPDFERINKAWVEQYFSLEPFDIAQLEQPEENILKKGGQIIFAQENNQILGTVAIIPSTEPNTFEMIKMGVSKEGQGRGIGFQLGKAILERARLLGANRVVLYSSSKLGPALQLYKKLGFQELDMGCSQYGRCNVKMGIAL
ncbi:GNAT family N-acetyltransferase [Cyclobacteriaceae bacterium YHN15]|jgi:GNAT superfamily N-acetyltransferase|nr:GNAT family N-acetyltransferase [Cyclobacteriaceae bacterium YHN15]